jgi:CheY-like chemotaxis protein
MEQKTVLVVDDEPGALRLCWRCLAKAGYKVLTASTGNLALATCRTSARPDLALIDLIMSAMDGPALAAQLEELHPGIVITLMSGFPKGDLPRLLARELPEEYRFIEKPFTSAMLIQAVRDGLEQASMTKPAVGRNACKPDSSVMSDSDCSNGERIRSRELVLNGRGGLVFRKMGHRGKREEVAQWDGSYRAGVNSTTHSCPPAASGAMSSTNAAGAAGFDELPPSRLLREA